jgi:hypothetical protein
MFKLIQTCLTEFTVHSAGLSANSASIHRLGISAGFYQFLPNSIGFFQKSTESEESIFLVSADFLNTGVEQCRIMRNDIGDDTCTA